MKKYIRGMVLTACILFCAMSAFGCGEVETSAQTDNSIQADCSDQAEEGEMCLHEQDEEYISGYANTLSGSRITYENGYYYYASQLDNYFLYRAKEDGSEPVCLAKVHPGTILVDEDIIYFVNLSDNNAIYRIGTDGSNICKICDNKFNSIEMSAEYIYFRDLYDREADIRGLVSESEEKAMEESGSHVFYRIRKDGSGKEILFKDTSYYTIADADGGKVMYDGYLYHCNTRWNEKIEHNETIITRYDLEGENEEEICRFDFGGFILVCGDRIYCFGDYDDNDRGKIGVYTVGKKEMKYLPDKTLTDRCIYNGVLYGLREVKDETRRSTKVYRLENGEKQWEEIYQNNVECIASSGYYYEGNLTDIYATEQRIFFRQFVSPEEGVKWFLLGEEGTVERWEDENEIPTTKPASKMEHTYDSSSIKVEFKSTKGYEDYLLQDITYEEFYTKDENGEGLNPYRIRLPQFNEKIEGYQEINAYFNNVYQEALGYMQVFFDMLDEENGKDEYGFPDTMLHEGIDYDYVYIGEKYITVAKYKYGYDYWYDVSDWQTEEPVTFERETGRVISLEEFFGDSMEEAIARATASIYKFMENGDGYGAEFFLGGEDILTKEFDSNQFFLFPEGIGLYYEKHSIDLYTVDFRITEDYLFLVPYFE